MTLSKTPHMLCMALLFTALGCSEQGRQTTEASPSTDVPAVSAEPDIDAKTMLGNPDYLAFCYGGFRGTTRDDEPSVDQLKEDMKILAALGVKLLRTYNTQHYQHATNLLEAIRQLRQEDPDFEMYVMLGAWIECEGAWTPDVNHDAENVDGNRKEIEAAIQLANEHPETVMMIAVGNEAMVHWATTYFVRPAVICKWVDHLQALKDSGELPAHIWITSSDNFASWGGGDHVYRTDELKLLIESVDFISLHTYPFHHTHYNPEIWGVPDEEEALSPVDRVDAAVARAHKYGVAQYQSTVDYIASLGIEKPVHIGETGWASRDSTSFGAAGSKAADEYKASVFYDLMREWTNETGITCFYFEAFDEQWKDAGDPNGSENHFGLINREGQAKPMLWDKVDEGVFDGLTRNGVPVTKTFGGDTEQLLGNMLHIPLLRALPKRRITTFNEQRQSGAVIAEEEVIVVHPIADVIADDKTYPSAPITLNVWEGTCEMLLSGEGVLDVTTGTGDWWGCALELDSNGKGENLTGFESGHLHFEIKGTASSFELGIQTGQFSAGTQVNYFVKFGAEEKRKVSDDWVPFSIPIRELVEGVEGETLDLSNVTALLYLRGENAPRSEVIQIRNVSFSKQ